MNHDLTQKDVDEAKNIIKVIEENQDKDIDSEAWLELELLLKG